MKKYICRTHEQSRVGIRQIMLVSSLLCLWFLPTVTAAPEDERLCCSCGQKLSEKEGFLCASCEASNPLLWPALSTFIDTMLVQDENETPMNYLNAVLGFLQQQPALSQLLEGDVYYKKVRPPKERGNQLLVVIQKLLKDYVSAEQVAFFFQPVLEFFDSWFRACYSEVGDGDPGSLVFSPLKVPSRETLQNISKQTWFLAVKFTTYNKNFINRKIESDIKHLRETIVNLMIPFRSAEEVEEQKEKFKHAIEKQANIQACFIVLCRQALPIMADIDGATVRVTEKYSSAQLPKPNPAIVALQETQVQLWRSGVDLSFFKELFEKKFKIRIDFYPKEPITDEARKVNLKRLKDLLPKADQMSFSKFYIALVPFLGLFMQLDVKHEYYESYDKASIGQNTICLSNDDLNLMTFVTSISDIFYLCSGLTICGFRFSLTHRRISPQQHRQHLVALIKIVQQLNISQQVVFFKSICMYCMSCMGLPMSVDGRNVYLRIYQHINTGSTTVDEAATEVAIHAFDLAKEIIMNDADALWILAELKEILSEHWPVIKTL